MHNSHSHSGFNTSNTPYHSKTPKPTNLPILTFHALDANLSVIAFPPPLFRRGVEGLARRGYRALALTEVAEILRRGGRFPDRSLVITFDDGYRSVFEVAYPALLEHGLVGAATVFLTVGAERPARPDQRLPALRGDRPMLSWREIRELQRAGMSFGAHTLTHPDLTRLPAGQIEREMLRSRETIEDALGVPVPCFAYPYGRYDRPSYELAREHFVCACTDRLGLVRAGSDPHALARVDAYYLRREALFGLLWTRWLSAYLQLRRVPRQMRRWVQAQLTSS